MEGGGKHDLGEDGEGHLEVEEGGEVALVIGHLTLAGKVDLFDEISLFFLDFLIFDKVLFHCRAEFFLAHPEFAVNRVL
jgi:hypothetical protein